MSDRDHEKPMSKTWHWHPPLPINLSPVMDLPPRPWSWLKWISSYWLVASSVTVEFALAWGVFVLFQPETAVMKELAPGWVASIWLRNILLLTLVAGSLHWWFYIVKGQGKALKYDPRDLSRDNGKFLFRDQVKDNMFWSLVSGVSFWTAFEVLYFWGAANGYAPGLEWRQNPIFFAVLFVLLPLWSSFHFYVIHRLLHWQPLYKLAHALHHRNINTGPWSGISMHPVEHLLYFSGLLIHFIVPSHPTHVLFHLYLESLHPAFSHSGFEGVFVRDNKRMQTGDFFHQMHHRHINCNYGTVEMPWDRLFGSFNDGRDIVGKEHEA